MDNPADPVNYEDYEERVRKEFAMRKETSIKLVKEYQLLGTNAEETFIKPTDDAGMVHFKESIKQLIKKCQHDGTDPEERLTYEPPDEPTVASLKESHLEVIRRYQLHAARVEQLWCSFDRDLRLLAMKHMLDQECSIPLDAQDRTTSSGEALKFVSDLNLHDMIDPGFGNLMDLWKFRATTSIFKQYREVDHKIIVSSMLDDNLQHPREEHFYRCYSKFVHSGMYGRTFSLAKKDEEQYQQARADLSHIFESKQIIPRAQGELIVERQLYIMNFLIQVIDDILYIGSLTRSSGNDVPRDSDRASRAVISSLSATAENSKKPQLPDILASALEHKSDLKDYLSLCFEEPNLLCHATESWFDSRPENVPDEKGRCSTTPTGKSISTSVFEMVHNSVIAVTIWEYLTRLLQLSIDQPKSKISRLIILQEISNVLHFEYARVQANFKRHVQSGSGLKYFKRNSNAYDGSTPRVGLKIKPEVLTREDPQLHYMLRLCVAETNASKAMTWIQKLDDLHQSYPAKRDEMPDEEFESFDHLVVTTVLIQSLSDCLPLPPHNLKKGQSFVSKSKDLSTEIDLLKAQLDLSNFAVPVVNLLRPEMAEGAVTTLDGFMTEKTGTTMVNLYEDLVEKFISQIETHSQRQKEKSDHTAKDKSPPIPAEPIDQTSDLLDRLSIQERREKNKTRPWHSSAYNSTPDSSSSTQTEDVKAETLPEIFKVKKDTFETFTSLFSRSESHGYVDWVKFEAAMVDLRFSVIPKFGSVYEFLPPSDIGVDRSITLHRPHKGKIEGYRLLIFARRLKRVYGWSENSFVVEAK